MEVFVIQPNVFRAHVLPYLCPLSQRSLRLVCKRFARVVVKREHLVPLVLNEKTLVCIVETKASGILRCGSPRWIRISRPVYPLLITAIVRNDDARMYEWCLQNNVIRHVDSTVALAMKHASIKLLTWMLPYFIANKRSVVISMLLYNCKARHKRMVKTVMKMGQPDLRDFPFRSPTTAVDATHVKRFGKTLQQLYNHWRKREGVVCVGSKHSDTCRFMENMALFYLTKGWYHSHAYEVVKIHYCKRAGEPICGYLKSAASVQTRSAWHQEKLAPLGCGCTRFGPPPIKSPKKKLKK